MELGIDFGTTHTTAALSDGHAVHLIALDPANADPSLLRSMIYISREHECVLGVAAIQRYLAENTGRPVQYMPRHIGVLQNEFSRVGLAEELAEGVLTMEREVYAREDVAAPGRLLQSIKTALRDPGYSGTTIYGRFYTIEALIARLLTAVKQRAEAQSGRRFARAVLGRPVRLCDTPEDDRLAEGRLRAAAHLAGFREVVFAPEPLAATRFYIQNAPRPQTILVFDFGGGTLDLTITRVDQEGQSTVIATHGVLVGGDDLDSALMRERVAPAFGVLDPINRQGHPFPSHLAMLLEHWYTIPDLSRDEHLKVIRGARVFGPHPERFRALEALATRNYGFALFERIEQAKRKLSTHPHTRIELRADAIDLALALGRPEFIGAIAGEITQVRRGLEALLAHAGPDAPAIDVVVTTGGSALIPIFQEMLRRRFPQARLVQSDTFGSVVAGLAMMAAEEWAAHE